MSVRLPRYEEVLKSIDSMLDQVPSSDDFIIEELERLQEGVTSGVVDVEQAEKQIRNLAKKIN